MNDETMIVAGFVYLSPTFTTRSVSQDLLLNFAERGVSDDQGEREGERERADWFGGKNINAT